MERRERAWKFYKMKADKSPPKKSLEKKIRKEEGEDACWSTRCPHPNIAPEEGMRITPRFPGKGRKKEKNGLSHPTRNGKEKGNSSNESENDHSTLCRANRGGKRNSQKTEEKANAGIALVRGLICNQKKGREPGNFVPELTHLNRWFKKTQKEKTAALTWGKREPDKTTSSN